MGIQFRSRRGFPRTGGRRSCCVDKEGQRGGIIKHWAQDHFRPLGSAHGECPEIDIPPFTFPPRVHFDLS